MTVQEILDFLNKVEDKTVDVYIFSESQLAGGLSVSIEIDDDGEVMINSM